MEGLWPASRAQVERFIFAVALNAFVARFESFSWIPSIFAIGIPNCSRVCEYVLVVKSIACVADAPVTGREIPLPTLRHSMSILQPWPIILSPPMTQSIGIKTSLPKMGPF